MCEGRNRISTTDLSTFMFIIIKTVPELILYLQWHSKENNIENHNHYENVWDKRLNIDWSCLYMPKKKKTYTRLI